MGMRLLIILNWIKVKIRTLVTYLKQKRRNRLVFRLNLTRSYPQLIEKQCQILDSLKCYALIHTQRVEKEHKVSDLTG
jgi:hypothetical protein